jgi:hypothetical protein
MESINVKGHVVMGMNECLGSVLQSATKINGKMHYAIMRNIKFCQSVLAKIEKEKQTIIESYADKDENGKVKVNDKGVIVYSEINQKEAHEAFNAILNEDYDLQVYKINIDDYSAIELDGSKLRYDALLFEYYIKEN